MISSVDKTSLNEAFLALVRLGIGHPVSVLPDRIDWDALKDLAAGQELSAILADGVVALANLGEMKEGRAADPGKTKQWIGSVYILSEQQYLDYRDCLKKLAHFYETQGLKMMVLKGFGLGLNYPRPEHRPCGDIDIWLFGKYKEADDAMRREMEIPIDDSHHHHTVFSFLGVSVENHYDFVNVHYGHRNAELERIFKELAADDSWSVDVDGQRVYLPSPNLHALFVLRHSQLHFASTGICLRMLLDWGMFVEKNRDQVDWPWFVGVCNKFHMTKFLACMNAICIEDLGFDKSAFSGMPCLALEKDRVLNDILAPEFAGETPSRFFPRALFKFRRWRANAWKYRLCFREPRLLALLAGIWSHLLKPSSI